MPALLHSIFTLLVLSYILYTSSVSLSYFFLLFPCAMASVCENNSRMSSTFLTRFLFSEKALKIGNGATLIKRILPNYLTKKKLYYIVITVSLTRRILEECPLPDEATASGARTPRACVVYRVCFLKAGTDAMK